MPRFLSRNQTITLIEGSIQNGVKFNALRKAMRI